MKIPDNILEFFSEYTGDPIEQIEIAFDKYNDRIEIISDNETDIQKDKFDNDLNDYLPF